MKNIFGGIFLFLLFVAMGYLFYTQEQKTYPALQTLNGFNIQLNPYGNNELAALVEFETLKPAQITITIKGRNGAEDISYAVTQEKTKHSIEVLGLYPDYRNKVVLTASYPDKRQESVLAITTPKVQKRNLFVITQKNDTKTRYHWLSDGMVFDEDGWMRFAFDGKGGLCYWFNHEIIVEFRNRGLYRYSPAGKLLQHYKWPKGFTSFAHGMGQKPNGNFLVIGSFAGSVVMVDGEQQKTHRDWILEIDYQTGEVLNKIDLAELLNPNRSVIVKKGHFDYGMNDWCHINGIDYDKTDGGIVVSCRHSGMIKVDEKTKKLVWMITPNKGFEVSGRQGQGPDIHHKVLTAVNAKGRAYNHAVQQGEKAVPDFKWPTKNHNAKVFEDGVFGLFDNSGPIHDKTVFTTDDSYASLFKVDGKKRTVQQYWSQPLEVHSETGSSVDYNAKEKDVIVFIAQVYDKNQDKMSYADLIRYDFDTHKELFHAVIYRGGTSWGYKTQEFSFSRP